MFIYWREHVFFTLGKSGDLGKQNIPKLEAQNSQLRTSTIFFLQKNTLVKIAMPIWLVVWNMNGLFFHSVGNFIIPTDELTPSFFRGVGEKPPIFWICCISLLHPPLLELWRVSSSTWPQVYGIVERLPCRAAMGSRPCAVEELPRGDGARCSCESFGYESGSQHRNGEFSGCCSTYPSTQMVNLWWFIVIPMVIYGGFVEFSSKLDGDFYIVIPVKFVGYSLQKGHFARRKTCFFESETGNLGGYPIVNLIWQFMIEKDGQSLVTIDDWQSFLGYLIVNLKAHHLLPYFPKLMVMWMKRTFIGTFCWMMNILVSLQHVVRFPFHYPLVKLVN